jgi:hypothetical protein
MDEAEDRLGRRPRPRLSGDLGEREGVRRATRPCDFRGVRRLLGLRLCRSVTLESRFRRFDPSDHAGERLRLERRE